MRCSDCGGHRRNPDNRRRELERRARQGDFRSQVQLLQLKMRSGEIPVDYVRCAAALGDKRAEALGLEPWDKSLFESLRQSILKRLPETLLVPFTADVAERVLYIFEDALPLDTRPREAIEAARRWVEDPSEENADAALAAAHASHAATRAAAADEYATAAAYSAAAAADAADAAANSAPWRVAYAEYAATAAARAATYADDADEYATAAEEAWQKQRLIKYLLGEIEV